MALPRVGNFFSEKRALAFEFCSFFSSADLKGLLGGNGTGLEVAGLALPPQINASVIEVTTAMLLCMVFDSKQASHAVGDSEVADKVVMRTNRRINRR